MKRHRTFLSALAVATLVIGAAFVVPSQAQTGGNPDPDREVFELEGNANDSIDYDGEDWENVYLETSDASATAWESEMSRSASIFTGGGSKDPNMIADWRWKNGGGLPDKDNLQHAFAARYGDLIVFGSDRYDNSGDAMQGFWFFQNPVAMNPDGTFSGEHVAGDLLILSDFSIGGTVSTIAVYKWVDSGGDVAEHLDLLFDSTSANCLDPDGTTSDGDVCGIVNPSSTSGNEVPWPFKDKSGNDFYLAGEFFEGGIDLSRFPDFTGTCFAGFAAETRSSTSPTATLKDFVIGGFESCGVDMNTTPSESEITLGETVYDHAVVTGSGITNAPIPTGSVSFYVCGPDQLDNDGLCSSGGTSLGSASLAPLNSTSNPSDAFADSATFEPDEVGTWCFRGEYAGEKVDPLPPNNYGPAVDYDVSECFTVVDYPSTTATAQSWTPNDSATITVAAGAPAWSGKVSFYLRSDSCTGTVLYSEEDVTVSSSAPTVSTSNTTYEVTASGSYFWDVRFTSSTNGVRDSSHCESTSMTITN